MKKSSLFAVIFGKAMVIAVLAFGLVITGCKPASDDDNNGGDGVTSGSGGPSENGDVQLYVGTNVTPLGFASIAATITWITANETNNQTYTIVPDTDLIEAPMTLFTNVATGITITLKGKDTERTVQLSGTGSLFIVSSGVTLVLDNDITLAGHSGNNDSMVQVYFGGTLEMKSGAKISGNTTSYSGGGVNVAGGTFTMSGGEISGNTITGSQSGGGVFVDYGGTVTVNGGKISDNTAGDGGGVCVYNGTLTMNGGEISGNSVNYASSGGGGVFVNVDTTFTMTGGEITNNTSAGSGGGVDVRGTLTLNGGEISGNTAVKGGGVYNNGIFNMNGGIIYGSDGGVNANKLEGSGTKQGVSLYKGSSMTALYGDGSAILAGTQTSALYTDATLTGHN